VLVVEDEPSMSASLKRGLEAEGFIVDVAEDGTTGLWMAMEFTFEAILLDVMLPGINGFVVARRLREAGRSVPILMLTAVDGHLDQADALDEGADDYVTKPFHFEVLLARLRALIRRAAGRSTPVLAAGDLSVDAAARRAYRGETEIALTAREFALLEYFVHRQGEVVSKSDLLRQVWEDDEAVSLNAVEVYVGYLRKKIDAPFGVSTLETVRGCGYRLECAAT
jgi:DNA-binding response OmpR family regulator